MSIMALQTFHFDKQEKFKFYTNKRYPDTVFENY